VPLSPFSDEDWINADPVVPDPDDQIASILQLHIESRKAGRDITFLVRGRRMEEIQAKGIQIVSPNGNLTMHPKAVTASQITTYYDAIPIGVKGYALPGAIDDLAAAVGPQTSILPVLNGMRHIDLLTSRFGKHTVLGGVCIVATKLDGEGGIHGTAGAIMASCHIGCRTHLHFNPDLPACLRRCDTELTHARTTDRIVSIMSGHGSTRRRQFPPYLALVFQRQRLAKRRLGRRRTVGIDRRGRNENRMAAASTTQTRRLHKIGTFSTWRRTPYRLSLVRAAGAHWHPGGSAQANRGGGCLRNYRACCS
jgi:hypothetical protein